MAATPAAGEPDGRSPPEGRVKQKVDPWPLPSDSTQIRPPWDWTIRCTIASPTPAPAIV